MLHAPLTFDAPHCTCMTRKDQPAQISAQMAHIGCLASAGRGCRANAAQAPTAVVILVLPFDTPVVTCDKS